MTKRKATKGAGRPIDHKKKEEIVDVAWSLFLEHGVEATALETIAARAAVSKVTLYRHFPDKGSLFEAGVLREMERIEAVQRVEHGAAPEIVDLRSTLIQFGIGIMSFLASPPAVSFYQTLAGELSRHPELARRFYAMGPGRTKANLSGLLAQAAKDGIVLITDPIEASDHLFGIWQGFSNFEFALGVLPPEAVSQIPRRVERAVDVFLRAYSAKAASGVLSQKLLS